MRFLFVVCAFFVSVACKQQKIVSNYNTPIAEIETYYTIAALNDSSTSISYSISSSDLYSKSSKNSKSYIYFEVEHYDEQKNILMHTFTSRTQVLQVSQTSDFVTNSITIPFALHENSSLRIRVLNTNSTLLNSYTQHVSNSTKKYSILNYYNLALWNQPYVYTDTCVIVNLTKNKEYMYYTYSPTVSYTNTEVQKYKSLIYNDSIIIAFSKIGNYTLFLDSLFTDTLISIPVVSNKFPKNNTPCTMLEALFLINPMLNIDSLTNTDVGCKIELDKLWLAMSKNDEMKAKIAIKTLYSRIEQANKMYTITQQGMHSNRGVCLILLGEPIKIQYNTNAETWYYSHDTTIQEKKFTFEKKNRGLQSEYVLQNSGEKTMFFDIAKLNWQQGNTFTLR